MKSYRRVVVATDFSAASCATIGAVEAIAGKGDLILHVVHVLEPIAYGLPASIVAELEGTRRAEADVRLERFGAAVMKRLDKATRIRSHVASGAAPQEICRLAETVRAHLVIVGSHGRTGLRRAMIGSVAERVVRHAGRPVLIVPGAGAHRRRR